jgi:glycosyltransferase involved in cell wall biosynthesis
VLAASLRRHHPDVTLTVLLVDEPAGRFDPAREPFRTASLADLHLPRPQEFCFRYNVVELSTAVRPHLLRHLFALGHDRVVYLDPDVRVYAPLDDALDELQRANVVVTPHLTRRSDDDEAASERKALLCGTYNMGFLALRRSDEVDRFLRWLCDRLERECIVDPANGLFVDQRWMDLAPGLVEGLRVLRHPGYNVGHWNLAERPLKGEPGRPTVDGSPLVFFHFSGFRPQEPSLVSRHHPRPVTEEPLRTVLASYGEELKAAGYDECVRWPYAHGVFSDGFPVGDELRVLFREQPAGRFPEPFLVDSDPSFVRWAITSAEAEARTRSERAARPVTEVVRLADLPPIVRRILAVRKDVRRAYETGDERFDRQGLLGWLVNDGVKDFHLKPEWCAAWGAGPAVPEVMPRLLALYDSRPDLQRLFPMAFVEEHDAPAFLEWIEAHAAEAGFDASTLERLRALFAARPVGQIRQIYARRTDVGQAYPCALDGPADTGFVGWLRYSGRREHGIPPDWTRWFARAQEQHVCLRIHQAWPRRRDWQQAHPRGLTPLGRRRFLSWLQETSDPELGSAPAAVRRLCPPEMISAVEELRRVHRSDAELQRRFAQAFHNVGQTEGLLAWVREELGETGNLESDWLASVEQELKPLGLVGHGVTVVGYLKAGFGLGELARATVRSLEAVEYPYATASVDHRPAWQSDFVDRPAPAPYPFSLLHLNPDGVRDVRQRLDLGSLPGRYRIGYWAWELEEMPPEWAEAFPLFDEVWTCSRHAAAALAAGSSVPVHTVWPSVEDLDPHGGPAPPASRDAFTFLLIYDLLSETERKNPIGLIEAFRRAFRKDDRVRLLVKTANGSERPEDLRRVVDAARGLPVEVRDGYASRAETAALLRACDAYASLHRAEGFGFTLAEAMALGKPVIATYYSGNVDFMAPWNSFPVPCSLVEVPARHGPYRPGMRWAEPDLDAAAALMRQVYERPEQAAEVAARGRADVLRLLSAKSCGERIEARFRAIRRHGRVDLR